MSVAKLVTEIVRMRREYYKKAAPGLFTLPEYIDSINSLKELDADHPILYTVGYDEIDEWWTRHYEVETILDNLSE